MIADMAMQAAKSDEIKRLREMLHKARAFLVIDQLSPAVHKFEIEKRVEFRNALIAEIDATVPRS